MSGLLQPNRMPTDLLGVRAPAIGLPMLNMSPVKPGVVPPYVHPPPGPLEVTASAASSRDNKVPPMKGYAYTTAKNFHCEKCGRSYASTGNLKRHLKYECGVSPQFPCPLCNKKFQHRHSVKIHVVSTHLKEIKEPTILAKLHILSASQAEIIRMARAEVIGGSETVVKPGPCSRDSRDGVEDFYALTTEASTGPASSQEG